MQAHWEQTGALRIIQEQKKYFVILIMILIWLNLMLSHRTNVALSQTGKESWAYMEI